MDFGDIFIYCPVPILIAEDQSPEITYVTTVLLCLGTVVLCAAATIISMLLLCIIKMYLGIAPSLQHAFNFLLTVHDSMCKCD